MVKGEDVKAKRRNKAIRKKNNRDPAAAVSARVAAIIAAKKRRHTGKRRQCQGMCFSLPTPQDPYNDRRGREDNVAKKNKKPPPQSYNKDISGGRKAKNVNNQMESVPRDSKDLSSGDAGCPSKFLCNCLNSIQDSLVGAGEIEKEKSFIANSWGFEFWKSYSLGKDILENSGTSPSVQQIAWIASTAADSIQRNDSEPMSLNSPFLLYLVPSQEKAVEVRSLCKPLKALGIHAVSLHSGSSVEHQTDGLRSCDPEFVVATPERLWELVSLKAIDLSDVSLLVVDAVDSLSHCPDLVKCIKGSTGNLRTVLFQGRCSGSSKQAIQLQSVLKKPFDTLSLDDTTDS